MASVNPLRGGAPPEGDAVQAFRVDALDGLGRVARLGPLVDTVLAQHAYPDAVSVLLGEALALTAALAGSLKFEGTFTTQVHGDGPVGLLVADYRTDGAMRGYARFDAGELEGAPPPAPAAPGDARLFGRGRMAFTVDQGPDTDRYQGLVPLEGGTLAASAHGYLARSEQLRSVVAATAARWPAEAGCEPSWRAGSLIVQQMPRGDGRAESADDERAERWREMERLLARLKPADLADPLALPPLLIGPLFRDYDVRLHPPSAVRFRCRCSRSRASAVVESLRPEERAELAVDGRIEVTCEYCNARYVFGADGAPVADS